MSKFLPVSGLLFAVFISGLPNALAMPEFARRYNVSCVTCHQAFPRLNEFGKSFIDANYKMPNWRDSNTLNLGDERLALPKTPPLALRAQTFVQLRDGEEIDPATGPTGNNSNFDFQAPYLLKLLSSSPLSEELTYYFYGIFAEKGQNGTATIEDAWIRHSNVFGSGVGMQLGQFQISDLMFPREVRLTFQDFYVYRAAAVTYERGVIFDRELGGFDVAVGAVNGNGVDENYRVNSPGYQRPDRLFDSDDTKTVFGRIGRAIGPAEIGIFGLVGERRTSGGAAGDTVGTDHSSKSSYGIDLSGSISGKIHWFGQALWNYWESPLDVMPRQDFNWFGGFAGVDYIANDRWVFSGLWNYVDASEFHGTATIFEGMNINAVSLGASYYFMRNIKGVMEATVDLLEEDDDGPPYVGHQNKDHSILLGFDMAL